LLDSESILNLSLKHDCKKIYKDVQERLNSTYNANIKCIMKRKNSKSFRVEYQANNDNEEYTTDWADRIHAFLAEFERTELAWVKFDLRLSFDYLESQDFMAAKENLRKLVTEKYASYNWNHNRTFAYEFTQYNAICTLFGYIKPLNEFKISTVLPSLKIVDSFHLIRLFGKHSFLNKPSTGK
jgi:hypothetical protein